MFTDMVRAHTAYMDRQLAYFNLSNAQGGVISILGRNGTLTQNELARFRHVRPATISIMLDRMERDGLVIRGSARNNNRANNVSLTEKGRRIFEQLDQAMENEPKVVFEGLDRRECEMAAEIFKKISENVRQTGEK